MSSSILSPPLRFTFGVHLHQPVGNFDSVFEEHVTEVYLPFLRRLAERDMFPIALHISGPLLEWMEAHDARYLDLLGSLVTQGKVELLLAGMYEPVLVALPREDRIEQIVWMREALARRFGVDARGLWLTERVWEPGLAADLVDAGVQFALVDDHHFRVVGFPPEQLHAPFWTESGGKRVALFPIDAKLRYLIPFHDPEETAAYLRGLRTAGHRLAVLADDGEKFGGWPGTRDLVYGRGWLDRFIDTLQQLTNSGEVMLSTFADALKDVPSGGLAYLPAVSYREMEMWSLPSAAAARLEQLEEDLGAERVAGLDGALLRGGHWRNFQVKYVESNRMHKKMLALSALCRDRGDPYAARLAIGRGQCNDAYWHGVFGGLYLPHLRQGVWRELARAEEILRAGEPLTQDVFDLDYDGADEIWVHSQHFSAVVSPARGGAIEELTLLATGVNYADTLTRRRESYHRLREDAAAVTMDPLAVDGVATPSIHDIENELRMDQLPPVDVDLRALFVDRVLPAGLMRAEYEAAAYEPSVSFANTHFAFRVEHVGPDLEIVLTADDGAMTKRIRFTERGNVRVEYSWDPSAFPPNDYFASEVSLAHPAVVRAHNAVDIWRFWIETTAKSEHGLERTIQGESITPRWPIAAGSASIDIDIDPIVAGAPVDVPVNIPAGVA
ncbi:MAG: alpha-amylase/4-alpha-glucanotransferase domain-containing protein [Gemmatimonadaceae bacterium]